MTRIDKVLRELSDLYEFGRRIKAYEVTGEDGAGEPEPGRNSGAVPDERLSKAQESDRSDTPHTQDDGT
jgi:hypothetical protein